MKNIMWSYIIAGIIILYLIVGIFPFARIETDSMAISNACQYIIDYGVWTENRLGHSYHMQSGTYFLIVVLAKLLHISTFTAYSVITALTWGVFLFLSLRFVAKLVPSPKIHWLTALLLLFPEFANLGYYANSAVISAAFYMMAFNIALKPDKIWKSILAGFLLGLAAWFRVDVAFAFPAILIVLSLYFNDLKKVLYYSALIALITVVVTLLLMIPMNAKVSGFLSYTKGHWKLFGVHNGLGLLDKSLIRAHISYFPIATLILVILGFVAVIKKKQWSLVGLWFLGIIFYYLLGINNNVAPKHLSYFLPFWSILALLGIQFLVSLKTISKKILVAFLSVLIFFQFIIGYKVSFKNLPYADKKYATLYPGPEILRFARIPGPIYSIDHIDVVLGTGTLIPTADEITPCSGVLFNPLNWKELKNKLAESFSELENYINHSNDDTLYFLISDGSTQFTINALLINGFQWQPELGNFEQKPYRFVLKKEGQYAILYRYMGFKKFDRQSFTDNFRKMPVNRFVVVFLWDWQNYMMREEIINERWELLGSNSYLVRK